MASVVELLSVFVIDAGSHRHGLGCLVLQTSEGLLVGIGLGLLVSAITRHGTPSPAVRSDDHSELRPVEFDD